MTRPRPTNARACAANLGVSERSGATFALTVPSGRPSERRVVSGDQNAVLQAPWTPHSFVLTRPLPARVRLLCGILLKVAGTAETPHATVHGPDQNIAKSRLFVARVKVAVRQHEPLYVSRDLVDLEIHARTDSELTERRRALGVRDDVHAEARALDRVDGEAHAIDGDRALRRQVACEVCGRCDRQPLRARFTLDGGDAADAVDVPGDQMAAERIAGTQCRLEIHCGAGREITERGERERLARYVGAECLRPKLDRGETASLDAQAVADACVRKIQPLTADREPHITTARLACEHPSDILHDPGEHPALSALPRAAWSQA